MSSKYIKKCKQNFFFIFIGENIKKTCINEIEIQNVVFFIK
jgi:hypothetical protein